MLLWCYGEITFNILHSTFQKESFWLPKRVLLPFKRSPFTTQNESFWKAKGHFEIAIIYTWIYYSLFFLYIPSTMESASEMLGTRISLHLSDRAT